MDAVALRQVMEELIPFNRVLGIRVVEIDKGHVRMEIAFREELIGDPVRRAVHGGVISALADTAGGCAVWSALDEETARVSTIDIRIDYLRPGRLESILAEAKTARVGRSVGVADIRVIHASARADTVATGKAVYVIKTPRNRP